MFILTFDLSHISDPLYTQ